MTLSGEKARGAAGGYPAAIVWDLDGTLADSAADLATALNTVLAANGLRTHSVAEVRVMIGHGVPKLIARGFRASGTLLEEDELAALVPGFMDIYFACATENTRLVPGAREVLERFKTAGVVQALCTNKPEAVTRNILATLEADHFFGSIVGGDSTPARKPDPLPLLTCLEQLGVGTHDAVMVGDSGADVGAARAAGVPIVLVPDGYTGAPPETLGADLVVGSLEEIPDRLPLKPFPGK